MAAWKLVTRPKSEGDLGVLKISVHNETLLMKNLHKFFNRHNIPRVQLLWKTGTTITLLPRGAVSRLKRQMIVSRDLEIIILMVWMMFRCLKVACRRIFQTRSTIGYSQGWE